MALVVTIPATRGHGGVVHEFVDLCGGLLGGSEGLHELQTEIGFGMEDGGTGVWARVDEVGLGAGEDGSDEDLGTVEEDVQAEMMTVELEAPWSSGGRGAEEDKVVAELIHDRNAIDKLAKVAIDTHGRDGLSVPFRGEDGLEDGKDGVADRCRELIEAETFV